MRILMVFLAIAAAYYSSSVYAQDERLEDISIEVSVSPKNRGIIIGEVVHVSVTVRNTGERDVSLHLPTTTLYGLLREQNLQVRLIGDKSGKAVPLRVASVFGPEPYHTEQIIKAGNERSYEYELFELADMSLEPGKYHISATYSDDSTVLRSEPVSVNCIKGGASDARLRNALASAGAARTSQERMRILSNAIKGNRDSSVAIRLEAQLLDEYVSGGKHSQAIELGKRLLETRPPNVERVRWHLARSFAAIGKYEDAVDILSAVDSEAAQAEIAGWQARIQARQSDGAGK